MSFSKVQEAAILDRIKYHQESAYPLKNQAYRVAKSALWALGVITIIPAILWTIARICCVPASILKASNTEVMKSHYEETYFQREAYFQTQPLTMSSANMNLDGQILRNTLSPESNRYILVLNPNAGFYQDMTPRMMELGVLAGAHIVGYNYPGVDLSQGYTDPETLKSSIHLALDALKDKLGAKEIVIYGISLGGALLANAMETYKLDPKIKYAFICDRTFSKISLVAQTMCNRLAGILLKIVNWEIDATCGFKNSQFKPLVIQRCDEFDDDEDAITQDTQALFAYDSRLTLNADSIMHDNVIAPKASLAKAAIANHIPVFKTSCQHMDIFDYGANKRLNSKIAEILSK